MPADLPSFQTERLILQPRTFADLGACLAMDRDPEVTRFIAGPWHDPVAHRAFVEARIRHQYPAGLGYWSIIAGGAFIGWRLVRGAWGRGHATEAARPILTHALETVGVPRVIADIDPANTASLGVARKLGFRPEGPVPYDGRMVIRFAITRGQTAEPNPPRNRISSSPNKDVL